MSGVLTSMTNANLILVTAAVLTSGADIMAQAPPRRNVLLLASAPRQEARQPSVAPRAGQDSPPPAAAKPAADRGPLLLQVEVVDPEGHSLPGADVGISIGYRRGSETPTMILTESRSDLQGQVSQEVAREGPAGLVSHASVWAYQAGRSVAATSLPLMVRTSPPQIRLTLENPAKWTITAIGPDDRPIDGLRIAPYVLRPVGRRSYWLTVPDEWIDRLSTTTDARGIATPTAIPPRMELLAVRVAGPGIAPHALPIEAALGKGVLKLGRPGRVVGIVRTASGQPIADVPVEVWVQGAGTASEDLVNRSLTPVEPLRLDPVPIRTGPQGAFQTPPTLLAGSSYRVSIRQDGFVPFVSDWVTLDGERATIPTIRLETLRTLTGQIIDRQGRAIAGARVFLSGHGPASTTDAEGRFRLGGIVPGKMVLLAEREGFRLRGWVVDPSTRAEGGSLTLSRRSEPADPVIKPLAESFTLQESRALAERLLEPYLSDERNKENSHLKLAAIAVLSGSEPVRALRLLQGGDFEVDRYYQYVLGEVAVSLAGDDPAKAATLVDQITDPRMKLNNLLGVARTLPASERDRKNTLLERAANLLKGAPSYQQLQSLLPSIAEQWLDMGERDRARMVLDRGKSLYDSLPPENAGTLVNFLMQLARIEPDQAMERLAKLHDPRTFSTTRLLYDPPAAVAVGLATDHPAEAERAFHLWERTGIQWHTNSYVIRLCRRLARIDPPRARRVADAQRGPAERSMAWAYTGLGLAETGKPGALEAVDRAIRELDQLRESGPGPDSIPIVGDVLLMYPTNPAALILPIVERAAPDRLDDVFWRAVALHPRLEAAQDHDLQHSYIGYECMLLSRYDRTVAAALFTPMDDYLRSLAARKGMRNAFASSHLVAKGCIDPEAAIALVDALTPPGHFDPPFGDFSSSNPAHSARLVLARALGLPSEKRWKYLWSRSGQLLLED